MRKVTPDEASYRVGVYVTRETGVHWLYYYYRSKAAARAAYVDFAKRWEQVTIDEKDGDTWLPL